MKSMSDALRNWIDRFLAVGGVFIIFVQVLLTVLEPAAAETSPEFARMRLQFSVVLVGILVNQIGVWRLANRLLPDRRKYKQLRSELQEMALLVRQLNAQAVAGESELVDRTREEMLKSVDRMVAVAGIAKTES